MNERLKISSFEEGHGISVGMKEQLIINRIREIFMKYGIRSVSMDDISRELGMSKKTLYHHFLNKTDLVGRVLQTTHEEFEQKVAAIHEKRLNAIDDLLELSLIIGDHMKEVNKSVSFDLQKYYPDYYREYLEKKRNFASRYVRQNIEKGISEDLYRDNLNIDLISKLYIQKIEDLHDPAFYDLEQISFDEVFQVMFENHIRGISNARGIQYFEQRKKTLKFE